MKRPRHQGAEYVLNMSTALVCMGFAFILLPFIYSIMLRQNNGTFKSKKFIHKYNVFMFGASLTNEKKS